MLATLLNPRVLAILAIVAVFVFMVLRISAQKTTIATLKGEKAVLEQSNSELMGKIDSLQAMVDSLSSNLAAARKSLKEMQAVKDEANQLRRRIIELQNQPTACEALKVEYEKLASDITVMFNDRVRGKVKRDSNSYRTAGEVLSYSITPDPYGPKVHARLAR